MTDENTLKSLADEVERIKHNNADWIWRDGVTLVDAVTAMREAADAIGTLRKENQELRELASIFDRCMGTPDCKTCPHHYAHGGSGGWNCRLDQLQEELGLLDGDA